MASRIGKWEWGALYAVAGTIDVVQWAADFVLGVGEGVNEIADPIIGIALGGYFQLRGVSMIKRPERLLSLVGGYLAEALSVSIAPAWIIDVWLIHKSVRQEEAQLKAMQEEGQEQEIMGQDNVQRPLYQNGIRRPSLENRQPLNKSGIRSPQ
jgi:hypothetical protein